MKENIWGRQGCLLPNGKLCSACCVLPQIELVNTFASVIKPANSPCPNLSDEGGCSEHVNQNYGNCRNWHCSQAEATDKIILISQAVALGQVSMEDAVDAAGKFSNSSSIQKEIFAASRNLLTSTLKRGLIEGEIIEP